MKKIPMFFACMFLLCAFAASCDRSEVAIEPATTDPAVPETLKGEAGAIKAVEDFMAVMKENEPATRSSVSTSIGAVAKKSVFDYSGGANAKTRSTDDDVAVYEITLENSDDTQGFAVVVDENNPTLLAFSEVGAIADTTYNPGLAFWFREMGELLSTEPEEPLTRFSYLFESTIDDPAYYWGWNKTLIRNVALLSAPDDRYLLPARVGTYVYQVPSVATNEWTYGSPIAWEQGYPYNMAITAKKTDGSNALIGCFGTAAASIICYHRYFPSDITYNWAGFQQWRHLDQSATFNPPMILKVYASLLCKEISEDSGAVHWYSSNKDSGAGSTSADGSEVIEAFQNKFNYHITRTYGYDMWAVLYEIAIKNRPVMIGAMDARWSNSGHIWVIDGYYSAKRYIYSTEMTTKKVNNKTMYSYDDYSGTALIEMLHMVWGFGGNNNGWYATFRPWNVAGGYDFSRDIVVFTEIYPNV